MKTTQGFALKIFLLMALVATPVLAQNTAKKVTEKPDPLLSFQSIGTATVKGDNVLVRGLPALKGDRITKLKKGETVTLLEEIKVKKPKKDEPAKWFRISLPANTPVWVHADFIDTTNMAVRPKKLNVRAGAGENYNIVARMQKGEAIKQIRKVNDWLEIEPPANAFAFVASQYLEKQEIKPSAPEPTVVTEALPAEIVAVPPVEEVVPAVDVVAQPPVEIPQPATVPATPEEPATKASEVLVKRIVKREGNVRPAYNIQAPAYFQLENLDGKLINYLHSPEELKEDPETKKLKSTPKFNLKELVGRTVIVTGEESMDKRWTRTPVLEIETITAE